MSCNAIIAWDMKWHFLKFTVFGHKIDSPICECIAGEVSEWLMVTHSKCVLGKLNGGSNPPLSVLRSLRFDIAE
jgi:hypothetical protein